MNQDDSYDYSKAGFDGFLSRPLDGYPQQSLDSITAPSRQLSLDSMQASGVLGDTLRTAKSSQEGTMEGDFSFTGEITFGDVKISGKEGYIVVSKDSVQRILIGAYPDGGSGLVISKEGYDVLNDVFVR